MGIGPDVWGPYIWASIHYITMGYPSNPTNEIKQEYVNFFESFKTVLPCSICRDHYIENLKSVPLTEEILNDREKLIDWGIDLHNAVNKMNGKRTYTYDEARKIMVSNEWGINKYFEMNTEIDNKMKRLNSKSNSNSFLFTIILIISALVFIAVVYKKK